MDKKNKLSRRKYLAPELTTYGSVVEFTQTGSKFQDPDGGASPNNMYKASGGGGTSGGGGSMGMCIGGVSNVEEHRVLLADRECQDRFYRAIQEQVKPGDVVLDLGTGSALHAMFACQAGASKVYAVEEDSIIAVAEEVVARNGMEDRIEFVYGNSNNIELPEKVDAIISNIGFLGLLSSMPGAAKRWLKPGGKLIPGLRLCFSFR